MSDPLPSPLDHAAVALDLIKAVRVGIERRAGRVAAQLGLAPDAAALLEAQVGDEGELGMRRALLQILTLGVRELERQARARAATKPPSNAEREVLRRLGEPGRNRHAGLMNELQAELASLPKDAPRRVEVEALYEVARRSTSSRRALAERVKRYDAAAETLELLNLGEQAHPNAPHE